MIAASLIETTCAAIRASRKEPSPASGPSLAGSLAPETSSANTAVSPSRPRKMHGASAPASESAIPGRNSPSSIGDFSAPTRNGSKRHIGNISEEGSRRLASIHLASVRFSLARLRGLPPKGIIWSLRKKAPRSEAHARPLQTSLIPPSIAPANTFSSHLSFPRACLACARNPESCIPKASQQTGDFRSSNLLRSLNLEHGLRALWLRRDDAPRSLHSGSL